MTLVLTQQELDDAIRGYVAHKTNGRTPRGSIAFYANYGAGDGQSNLAHYGKISVVVDLDTSEGVP